MTFHISITDTQPFIVREYDEGIKLDGEYEVSLRSFVTYNTIPNISPEKHNNEIFFMKPRIDKKGEKNGLEGYKLTIPKGTYEVADLTTLIKNDAGVRNIESDLVLELNKNTLRTKLSTKDCTVEAPTPAYGNTVLPLLGFDYGVYPPNEVHIATKPVDIMPINTIRIRCNLIESNYDNTKWGDNILYEFPLNSEVGEKIIERPNNLAYYKVIVGTIYTLTLSIVDQDNKLVDFCGERISINLEFRPVERNRRQ